MGEPSHGLLRQASTTLFVCVLLPSIGATAARAQASVDWGSISTRIETDGSLPGTAATEVLDDNLDGVHEIPQDLGYAAGRNLFHSFSWFDLGSGDTARFTANDPFDNVISRVTGGDPSRIDGTLDSSAIAGADFFFLNPSGVIFGPGATIDVPASFHVSGADQILGIHDGTTAPLFPDSPSALSTASPVAFGFLGASMGSVVVESGHLEVPPGHTLELVGRGGSELAGVRIWGEVVPSEQDPTLKAPGGRIRIVAVASAGEVEIAPGADAAPELAPVDQYGLLRVQDSLLSTSGDGGGLLELRGGRIELRGAQLVADVLTGASESGGIYVTGEELVAEAGFTAQMNPFTGQEIPTETELRAESLSGGKGGDIRIDVNAVTLRDKTLIQSRIAHPPWENAGVIEIRALNLQLEDEAQIRSGPQQKLGIVGTGGEILILADRLTLAPAPGHAPERILSWTKSEGDGGDITIRGRHAERASVVVLEDGSQIASETFNSGAGGDIEIASESLVLRGENREETNFYTEIRTEAPQRPTEPRGKSGDIDIRVGDLHVDFGSQILTKSASSADAGSITIDASRSVTLEKTGLIFSCLDGLCDNQRAAGIASFVEGSGRAGDITVDAPMLTVDQGTITSTTAGGGDSGDVQITVDRLLLDGGGVIRASTEADGNAGIIDIDASESITLGGQSDVLIVDNPGIIKRFSARGNFVSGIFSAVGNPCQAAGESCVGVSSGVGTGDGGDIRINSTQLSMEGAVISAATTRGSEGEGGNILLEVDHIALEGGAQIGVQALGQGGAGVLEVKGRSGAASGSVSIGGSFDGDRPFLETPSGIYASSSDEGGKAGRIEIDAASITIDQGGTISARLEGAGVQGEEGKISIRADRLSVVGEGRIDSSATGGGDAGSVEVVAREVALSAGGMITTQSVQSDGGNVEIAASQLFSMVDAGVDANVNDGTGGNITIQGGAAVLKDSSIVAQAGDGQGGEIEIVADPFINVRSEIDASAGPGGTSGIVEIKSPETNLVEQATPLPAEFLDASSMMLASCAARRTGERAGSFTVTQWRGLPPTPEGPLLAFEPIGDGLPPVAAAGTPIESDALRGRAQAQLMQGEYAASVAPLEKALSLARESSDRAREAAALGDLGNAYVALAEPERAEAYLAEAVRLARGTGNPARVGGLLNNLGNYYAIADVPAQAQAAYLESAALAHEAQEFLLAAQALANAARVSLDEGRGEEAADLLERAREGARALETSRGEVSLLIHLAGSYTRLAELSPAHRETSLLSAHGALLEAGAESKELRDAHSYSYAQGNLGALYQREQRTEEALYLTREALRAAEQAEAPDLLPRWYAQAGQILWAAGAGDAARDAYRRAVDVIEEVGPESRVRYGTLDLEFQRQVEPFYLGLVDALLQDGDDAEPVHARARLAEARATVERWRTAELRDYFRDECVAELEAQAAPVETLSRSAAVVYPILLPERIELLVSGPSGIGRYAVPVGANTVTESARSLRRLLQRRTTLQFRRPAQQLYDWLVRPYAQALAEQGVDTLVFVAGGALRTIPMGALHDGEGFLVERFALAVTPSLKLLAPKPLEPTRARLLLAGVSEPVQGYPGLASVPTELAEIRDLYGGEVLLNDDFQLESFEEALRERHPGVVHLASHATFTGDPRTSFVLTHDTKLTMERLSELVSSGRFSEEPLELLLLSACQTAAGDDRAALGLSGVAIRAGARSALGSLWNVSDRASSQLLVDFYRGLAVPGASKAQALQRAQQQLIAGSGFEHPFYWAPFLVINNWL